MELEELFRLSCEEYYDSYCEGYEGGHIQEVDYLD